MPQVAIMFAACLRVACAVIFLVTALSITWQSAGALAALILSFVLPMGTRGDQRETDKKSNYNPLKGKAKVSQEELRAAGIIAQMEHDICQFVTYDAAATDSLHHFSHLQLHSQCIFAKQAKVWGSPNWKDELSLEENVLRTVPTFYKFVCLCSHLGLDAFVFELPETHGANIETFGEAVRRVLTVLSDNDPAGVHCMDCSYLSKRGWVFEFDKVSMFVTTFAACYPEHHSRYSFESPYSYVLFQPEISFAQHDLPPDSTHTNWDTPQTVRDRIRVNFKDAGRPYKIPHDLHQPMAHEVVKPLNCFDGSVLDWWNPRSQYVNLAPDSDTPHLCQVNATRNSKHRNTNVRTPPLSTVTRSRLLSGPICQTGSCPDLSSMGPYYNITHKPAVKKFFDVEIDENYENDIINRNNGNMCQLRWCDFNGSHGDGVDVDLVNGCAGDTGSDSDDSEHCRKTPCRKRVTAHTEITWQEPVLQL